MGNRKPITNVVATINLVVVLVLLSLPTQAASNGRISGAVKDPKGAAFAGAFVRARNEGTKVTVNVLSDEKGYYRMQNLPAGNYEVQANAVGYESNLRSGVKVGAGSTASLNFSLRSTMVRWNDLSIYQTKKLLPEGNGKEILSRVCSSCHAYQTRIAAMRRDEAHWRRAVQFMRESMHFALASFSDHDAAELAAYLNSTFGIESRLPRSPAELPGYQETVRRFSNEAWKIMYVEYELPGPDRMPFSGAPDKDGNVWIPYFSTANSIAKLDPRTAAVQEFRIAMKGSAGIHSAVPAQDGAVWLAIEASNALGRWDPATRTITRYQDAYIPGKEGIVEGGHKHTVRVDPAGNVWASGSPFTRFDPKTRTFTRFPEAPSTYGVAIDPQGDPWFTEFIQNGEIGKVDTKTGNVVKWTPPTPDGRPRRIEIDSDGIVWFAEYRAGKIGRFDPQTETFREFQLPGPSPTPYGLGIDKNHQIWYSSHEMDVLGRLDPATGKVTEYPFPHSENIIKEFFRDSEGRIWYASAPNNKVGYFTLASDSPSQLKE